MDLSQFGGSSLENKALERALKRRKDKDLPHKPRERPLLARANAIRRDEERDALRPPPPVVQHRLSQSKRPSALEGDEDGDETTDGHGALKTGISKQESGSLRPSETLRINANPSGSVDSLPSPNLFPHSPFDTTPMSRASTPDSSEGVFTPRHPHLSGTNSIGEPLLDSNEVRKYFGDSGLDSFNQKVSFVNRQKQLLVKCPSLHLNSSSTSTSRSLSSASTLNRSRINSVTSLIGAARVSAAQSSISISAELLSRPGSRTQKGGRDKNLVRSHSKIHDQLRTNSSISGSTNASPAHHRKPSFFNNDDDSSLMSDVTGPGEMYSSDQASLSSLEFLREKREFMLSQRLFKDTCGQDTHKDLEAHSVEPCVLEPVQSSPRSAYIMGCLSDNLNPRGSHIVRKKISDELHLEHRGMGDNLIEHLATALQFLPHVSYVNIADNNLTDWGLVNVLSTIINCKHLLILDMSQNRIGTDTADALASYLRGNPPLQRLILSKTDIDDFEGEMFVKAVHHSTNLIELNLSKNQLGNQEVLNSVRPNTTTAPEELADLLTQRYCSIRELNLAWNVIRLDSAVCLAKALSLNESLMYLDLSYNCIGPEGGKVIGESLFENRTLQTLLMANNSIDSTSCFIICAAIQQNFALTHLCMDGNPVGVIGAKSLMNIPAAVGSRLTLTADKCNVKFRSQDNNWFDEDDPCGKYTLDMSDSFSRAVAFKILAIAANHYSYDIKKCSFSERKESREKIPILLEQRVTREKVDYMTPKEKKILHNLFKLKDSAQDISLLTELFHEYDFNQSGTLEHFELKILLDDLGLELADNQIENAMTFIDMDKSGSIDLSEFIYFMQQYREDVMERIRDMTEKVVMAEKQPDRGEHEDSKDSSRVGEEDRYIPPKSGFLHIELVDTYLKKAKFNVITEVDCNNIINIAGKIGNITTMIGYSLHSAKLRFNEALKFFDVMFHDVGNKAEVLLILLPRMMYPMEARILVSRVTNEDSVEIEFVKQKCGNCLRPIFGLPCGYYSMDLSKVTDRICLVKLFEFGIGFCSARKKANDPFGLGMMGDTSQLRNWSSFRNEIYNEELFKVAPDLFNPIPKEGLLEFDFVVHELPTSASQIISDQKLTQILINTSLVDIRDKEDNFKALIKCQKLANKCQNADGKLIYKCDPEAAAEIGYAQSDFYDNLYDRSDFLQEGIKREEIKVDFLSLQRRQPMLARLASMTNQDPLMRQVLPNRASMTNHDPLMRQSLKIPVIQEPMKLKMDNLKGVETQPSAESFAEKFNEFINRPLGKHQQKLLEQNMANMVEDKSLLHAEEDISEICTQRITRTEVYIKKNKNGLLSPSTTGLLAPVSVAKPTKKKSRKGETVTLPSIVVVKNNKEVVLPALTIAKEEEEDEEDKEKNAESDLDGHEDTLDSAIKGVKFDPKVSLLATRARMFSSSNLAHSMGNMGAEYNELQKRMNLLTKNRRRMRKLAEAMQVSRHAKASRLLSMLVDYVGVFWVKCRHVANIMQHFVMGMEDKAENFGTYRVEFVVSMFSKIVDIHNFDLILKELVPKEQGCLYCRLGWLNLFNPTRPERSYELNMAIWEERMVAKALLKLALVEEGDNVSNADFRWSRDVMRMPGWLVTKPWMDDHTMQRKGILTLTYVSCNEDIRLVPNIPFRKSLLNMVLSCESDMRPEELKTPEEVIAADEARAKAAEEVQTEATVMKKPPLEPEKLVGMTRLLEDKEIWTSYFYADKDLGSKITFVTKSSL